MDNQEKKQYTEPKYEAVEFDETIMTTTSGCKQNYFANATLTGCNDNELWYS